MPPAFEALAQRPEGGNVHEPVALSFRRIRGGRRRLRAPPEGAPPAPLPAADGSPLAAGRASAALVSRKRSQSAYGRLASTSTSSGHPYGDFRIRQALGDSPESPRFVASVPGKGYRFVAAVTRLPIWSGGGYDTTPEPQAPARRDNLPVSSRASWGAARRSPTSASWWPHHASCRWLERVGLARPAWRCGWHGSGQSVRRWCLAGRSHGAERSRADCTDDRRQRRRSPKRGSIGGRGADPVLPHPRPSPHPGHLRAPARRAPPRLPRRCCAVRRSCRSWRRAGSR